jgi:hypothetical protein
MQLNCNALTFDTAPRQQQQRRQRLQSFARTLHVRDQYLLAVVPFLLMAMKQEEQEEQEEANAQELCWWSPQNSPT